MWGRRWRRAGASDTNTGPGNVATCGVIDTATVDWNSTGLAYGAANSQRIPGSGSDNRCLCRCNV